MTTWLGAVRRVEPHLPALLALTVAAATWASATGGLGVRSPLPTVVILPLALATGASVLAPRRWVLPAAAAVCWLVLAAWAAVVVASWRAGTCLRGRQLAAYLLGTFPVLLAGVAVGAAMGGERRLVVATAGNAALFYAWLVIAPAIVGLWIGARRDALAALRDRAERLEREQEARADRARAEERARIAREMHDVVAHRVSLMVVHAGALEVTTADPATVETAALIRSTGRAALTDLREVLGVLRQEPPPPLPGRDAVGELVRESRVAGLRVSLTDEVAPGPMPGAVARTVHRVVQEGLTNVRKHAPDAAVAVRLRHLIDGIEVTVRNDPSDRPGPVLPGAGLGLVGLRERVELTGGRLTAGPTPDGGFLLRALVPAGETT
ncbi:sensor histidine kinase [Micromonospora krabiensis]|uniref:histidine kinase n=1 Tax=Micromonospora krabiensis TaxID=307121 RepID=A0A1C3N882_9ACTN|nr:histidine kinase [Micromonospora krabiensis]SBV28736.1 Signal transduction histidine kinase [Micromonospora krabiensis]